MGQPIPNATGPRANIRHSLRQLRAEIVSLKTENERMVERLTDELNRFAERLEELEA